MKKIIVTLFSLIFASAMFAADASVAGVWKLETEVVGNTSSSLIIIKQDGNKLTCTTKGPQGEEIVSHGKVEGNKVTWSMASDWEGNELTVTNTGTLDENGVITGTTDIQPMGIEGTFVAKRHDEGKTDAK